MIRALRRLALALRPRRARVRRVDPAAMTDVELSDWLHGCARGRDGAS